jgi:hypothetical protein
MCKQCEESMRGQLRIAELNAARDLLARLEQDKANGHYGGDFVEAEKRVREAEADLERYCSLRERVGTCANIF